MLLHQSAPHLRTIGAEDLEHLKQRLPLLDYLRQSHWTARRAGTRPEFVGLCPLHPETQPSFYVNARKNLFYCHGCGRGGDLIRFVELSQGLSFRQSVAYRQQHIAAPVHHDVLEQAVAFYQFQLRRHPEAVTRATGMRMGECIDLTVDGLRPAGEHRWQLQVPLGKLRTERRVPADEDIQRIVARILALRTAAPPPQRPNGEGLLLPCRRSQDAFYQVLTSALADAGQRAGGSTHATPHRLRHSFATEMIRLGVRLPAFMQLLGHKDIRMTLRYVEVTQVDLQREFHAARQNALQPHRMPVLPVPPGFIEADLPGICQAISTARHLLEMYRRQLVEEKERRRLQRLDKRLLAFTSQLEKIATAEK